MRCLVLLNLLIILALNLTRAQSYYDGGYYPDYAYETYNYDYGTIECSVWGCSGDTASSVKAGFTFAIVVAILIVTAVIGAIVIAVMLTRTLCRDAKQEKEI